MTTHRVKWLRPKPFFFFLPNFIVCTQAAKQWKACLKNSVSSGVWVKSRLRFLCQTIIGFVWNPTIVFIACARSMCLDQVCTHLDSKCSAYPHLGRGKLSFFLKWKIPEFLNYFFSYYKYHIFIFVEYEMLKYQYLLKTNFMLLIVCFTI